MTGLKKSSPHPGKKLAADASLDHPSNQNRPLGDLVDERRSFSLDDDLDEAPQLHETDQFWTGGAILAVSVSVAIGSVIGVPVGLLLHGWLG